LLKKAGRLIQPAKKLHGKALRSFFRSPPVWVLEKAAKLFPSAKTIPLL